MLLGNGYLKVALETCIPPGYRVFPENATARVRFIKRAKELGFSLKEIKELLALRIEPGKTRADVKERVESKLSDIEEKIKSLREMRKSLAKITKVCSGNGPVSDCSDSGKSKSSGVNILAVKRRIEVFSAGCPACQEAINLVRSIASPSCEVEVLDMHKDEIAAKAKRYGVVFQQ